MKLKMKIDNILSHIPFIKTSLSFLKNHKNILHQYEITKDYITLKKYFNFLKENNNKKINKKVLIVSLTHFLYQVKLEAMLAKALQLAGCDIEVLTWKHCFWPKEYFRIFGINKFVYFEDYLNKLRNKDYKREKTVFLKQEINFQAVKKWRYKDCRIGQQVLSTIIRKMHGTPDILQPKIYEIFSHQLHKELKAIDASEIMLNEVKPDILIFNEANGSIYGGIFDLAFNAGLDTIQFVQPFRDDALIFKRFDNESKGLHPNSVSKSTFEKIKGFDWTDKHEEELWQEFSWRYNGKWFLSSRNQIRARNKSKEEIIKQLGLDKNKKTAIIFSHILWDANLFYGEDLFEDYEDWFIETIKAACNNTYVNWIVKLHPANIWKRNRDSVKGDLREIILIKESIGNLPPHIYLLYPETDINTFSLFNFVDYGITVRGTTGMELPCFGKPVFTAGTGRYSGLGFTIDSDSKEDYLDKLSRIHDFSPLTKEQNLTAKKHAYVLFNLRPWIMESFETEFKYKNKGAHPFDHNLHPKIKSLEELYSANDLRKFTNWVLNSKESDYLNRSL